MERNDEELSSPVTVNPSFLLQHSQTHPITCSGHDGEVASGAHVQCVELATGSQISSCHRQEADGHCGGGATTGTVHVTNSRASTPDPQDVTSDDASCVVEPPPLGELALLTAAFSRNTFESGRRESALGQLEQDDPDPQSELQSRRPDIVQYFSR